MIHSNMKQLQINNDTYYGEVTNNVPHGTGVLKYKNGDTYEGGWVSGKKSGVGTLIINSGPFKGQIYIGEFKKDTICGAGVRHLLDGSKFTGIFESAKNGKGLFMAKNGNQYDGSWVNLQLHGQVARTTTEGDKFKETFINGILKCSKKLPTEEELRIQAQTLKLPCGLYIGDHEGGKPHGHGRMSYCNGDIYDGSWQNGKRSGNGAQAFKNGDIYTGSWKNNQYKGQGQLILANKQIYQGEWVDGLKSGVGKYTWPNGDEYQGNWLLDKKCGIGTMVSGHGYETYEGQFKNNRFFGAGYCETLFGKLTGTFDGRNGFGTFSNYDGVYEATWVNMKLHGKQIRTTADGQKFQEEWINGERMTSQLVVSKQIKRDQQNVKTYRINLKYGIYEGEALNGLPHGKGTLDYNNGNLYQGDFENGKRHGQGSFFFARNGEFYNGAFRDDAIRGFGIHQLRNGSNFSGYFNSQGSGNGQYTALNGDIYSGFWTNFELHGLQLLTRKNGEKYDEIWNKGKRVFQKASLFSKPPKYSRNVNGL